MKQSPLGWNGIVQGCRAGLLLLADDGLCPALVGLGPACGELGGVVRGVRGALVVGGVRRTLVQEVAPLPQITPALGVQDVKERGWEEQGCGGVRVGGCKVWRSGAHLAPVPAGDPLPPSPA